MPLGQVSDRRLIDVDVGVFAINANATPACTKYAIIMMTSSNGKIFRVTGHLCGEFTSHRPVTRSFDVFFDLRLNNRYAGDLGRHRAHYDIIMCTVSGGDLLNKETVNGLISAGVKALLDSMACPLDQLDNSRITMTS